jgi:hypothetical protein
MTAPATTLGVDDREHGRRCPLHRQFVGPDPHGRAYRFPRLLVDPVEETELPRVEHDQSGTAGVVDAHRCHHVERGPRSVRGEEQLALEGAGGGEPFGGPSQPLIPIGVADTGTRCSHQHVQGLTRRHEQARSLTALAGEVFGARQSPSVNIEQLAHHGVVLREREHRVGYETLRP